MKAIESIAAIPLKRFAFFRVFSYKLRVQAAHFLPFLIDPKGYKSQPQNKKINSNKSDKTNMFHINYDLPFGFEFLWSAYRIFSLFL